MSKTLESVVVIESATRLNGAPVSERYSIRLENIGCMALLPPSSLVFEGMKLFCGSVPKTETVASGSAAPLPVWLSVLLPPPQAVSSNAAEVTSTAADAQRVLRMCPLQLEVDRCAPSVPARVQKLRCTVSGDTT